MKDDRECQTVKWKMKYDGAPTWRECDLAGFRLSDSQIQVVLIEVQTHEREVSDGNSEGPKQAKNYTNYANEVWLFSLAEIPVIVMEDANQSGYGLARMISDPEENSFDIQVIQDPQINSNQNLPLQNWYNSRLVL